ncbi:uncharacterized protein LOC141845349 [Curcuma longa]|uniref:uncharacterized protein LOC141845349 n=1 Tax=Curcuma longa TaxID=136217 RepID=UPI003D9EC654
MQLVHLGLVMIRVHALHHRNAGVNALVVLRDTRWTDDRSIIGTMEIDLSEGTQLVYIAPNMLISLEDFYHHIELAIQTHGYEGWNTAESNLLITRGLIGRLTNTGHAGFRYNVQNVADYLASAGIHAVSAAPRTTAELQGMRWTLQPPAINQVRIPQEVRTTTLMDGSVVLSFQGYQSAKQFQPRRMSNLDIEEIKDEGEEEFIGMLSAQYVRKNRKKAKRCKDVPSLQNPQPIWDTLGWPSGRYDFLVDYSPPIRPPEYYLPITPTGWGDDDDNDDDNEEECALPSIWEDTPWDEDPLYELEDEPSEDDENRINPIYREDNEEDLSAYFLGLSDQEMDYPINSPTSVLGEQQPPHWDTSSPEDEQYWQQVVQEVEQAEEQYHATREMNSVFEEGG